MTYFTTFLCLVAAQSYLNKGWMMEAQDWEDSYLMCMGVDVETWW